MRPTAIILRKFWKAADSSRPPVAVGTVFRPDATWNAVDVHRDLTESELAVLDTLLAADRWYNANEIQDAAVGRITGKTARAAGDRLAERGLIERKEVPWGKGVRPVYRLPPPDAECFAVFVESYFGSLERLGKGRAPQAALEFLTSRYAKALLTPVFVRSELVRRQVEMRRMIRIDREGRLATAATEDATYVCQRFPVAASEAAAKATIAKAVDLIEYARYPHQRETVLACIEEHYANDERHRLILPLLALMQVSQGALREFVSDWKREAKPDNEGMSFNEKGLQMVEPVLFRMIYVAIADLATTRAIPKRMDATWATVCPEPVPVRQDFPPALLEIQWRLEGTIGYWAGFVAQAPFTTPQVTTWWRDQAINGPPPSQR